MDHRDPMARRFENSRTHLRAVAYRMLGSLHEADDAVQEAWLRVSRAETSAVENERAWLTTIVARICLDMLRSRNARREEPSAQVPDAIASSPSGIDPEHEAVLADSVGLALLVVLDTLAPPERLSFVLHDLFGVPFEEIAPIVGRTPAAARKLASRARRRVQGAPAVDDADFARQRGVVTAFLAALRDGDYDALVAVLDPDLVVRVDAAASPSRSPVEIRGAATWAKGAVAFSLGARFTRAALVEGEVGAILAPHGRLLRVLRFSFAGDKIASVDITADPERVRALEVSLLEPPSSPADD